VMKLSAPLASEPERKSVGSSMTSTSNSVINEAPTELRPPKRGRSFSE
jgi:hypothetical protein